MNIYIPFVLTEIEGQYNTNFQLLKWGNHCVPTPNAHKTEILLNAFEMIKI